jgi:hypothetical protein
MAATLDDREIYVPIKALSDLQRDYNSLNNGVRQVGP